MIGSNGLKVNFAAFSHSKPIKTRTRKPHHFAIAKSQCVQWRGRNINAKLKFNMWLPFAIRFRIVRDDLLFCQFPNGCNNYIFKLDLEQVLMTSIKYFITSLSKNLLTTFTSFISFNFYFFINKISFYLFFILIINEL